MSKLSLIKVVLSSGKVALLREMKISDTEKAAQMVASKANGEATVMAVLMQKAYLQLLLVKVGKNNEEEPHTVTGNEREDLDSLFTMAEYGQLLKVIGKLSGGDEAGNDPKIEMVAQTDS